MHTISAQHPLRVRWAHVAVFYALACLISWPFFWWRDIHPESWAAWRVPGILKNWCIMWGPGIAAIVCLILFRRQHRRTITGLGSSAPRSLLFYFVPNLLLCIPGIPSPGESMNEHVYPVVIAVLGGVSILGEELGWRGFLQDAVRPLSPVERYALIGVMWELWHFTNRTHFGPLSGIFLRVGLFIVVGILLSALIGWATDRSRSVVVAVTLHGWIDTLFETSGPGVWIVTGVSLVFWAWMLWRWKPALRSGELAAASTPSLTAPRRR